MGAMAHSQENWIEIDREGLAKQVRHRGKGFVIRELVQNAWDESPKTVDVHIRRPPNSPFVEVSVTDDSPNGWYDLAHVFTMFAPSYKAAHAEQRGRWCSGDKMVLAIARCAHVETMDGTVSFNASGRRLTSARRSVGTRFVAEIRMTREEYDSLSSEISRLIPPEGIRTTFNGAEIHHRKMARSFSVQLPTILADEEGNLRPTRRKTEVRLYDPLPGEVTNIYEMGIPVVEAACQWHIDVQQKVPLNSDRDNVTPAYLREVYAEILNNAHGDLDEVQASKPWATSGAGHKHITPQALWSVQDKAYGKKRVMYDPSDTEANGIAFSKGYTVIHGRSIDPDVAARQREFRERGIDITPRSGLVTPSPTAYSKDPDAPTAKEVGHEKWTSEMEAVEKYVTRMAEHLLGIGIKVRFMRVNQFSAAWCPCPFAVEFHFGYNSLGKGFFARACSTDEGRERLDSIIIHEFAHHHESDHLSSKFHDACCDLGAKMARLARNNPGTCKIKVSKEKTA